MLVNVELKKINHKFLNLVFVIVVRCFKYSKKLPKIGKKHHKTFVWLSLDHAFFHYGTFQNIPFYQKGYNYLQKRRKKWWLLLYDKTRPFGPK